MDYQPCYTFKPKREEFPDDRPAKRRRTTDYHGLHRSWPRREQLYQNAWETQGAEMKSLIDSINEDVVSNVVAFVQDSIHPQTTKKLPAALITVGPNLTIQPRLFTNIEQVITDDKKNIFVKLLPSHATNLKSLLVHLIRHAVPSGTNIPKQADEEEDDEDEETNAPVGQRRLLKYDLQILANAVEQHSVKRVVVAFEDCLTLDASILSDLIEMLSSWLARIPMVLVFGLTTSIQALQSRLSRAAIRCIAGRQFNVASSSSALEKVFAGIRPHDQSSPRLGSSLCSTILARQHDGIQSLQDVYDAVQYAYMTAFYANALTLFFDSGLTSDNVPADHFEAVRNLPSFKRHVEQLLEQSETQLVQQLLSDDEILFSTIQEQMNLNHEKLTNVCKMVDLLKCFHDQYEGIDAKPWSELYVQAMGGRLSDSPATRNLMMSIARSDSATLLSLVEALLAAEDGYCTDQLDLTNIQSRLESLFKPGTTSSRPVLKSRQSDSQTQYTTNIVGKKVGLARAAPKQTKADQAFNSILDNFVQRLSELLSSTLINPKSLVFYEILIIDARMTYSHVAMPKTRFAIERALSSPHDYLDCACCEPENGNGTENVTSILSQQPATALLYQLYLESESLINVADLRSVFEGFVSDVVQDGEQISALFQRALAELAHLGLIKGTRKKMDHVVKLAWKGL